MTPRLHTFYIDDNRAPIVTMLYVGACGQLMPRDIRDPDDPFLIMLAAHDRQRAIHYLISARDSAEPEAP